MTTMQATVLTFDPETGSGTVVLDNGRALSFSPAAFTAGGLRLLRPGQRVRLEQTPDGTVGSITIATMGAS
ncbi:MAG: hypothetical protein ACR2LE_01810 [Nocardioidaceae bacterium]